ncbi:MAG: hypothetical protein R2811_17155 [Flavobacteriales bacterium]
MGHLVLAASYRVTAYQARWTYGDCDPPDSLVIADTSTVVYDGLALRQWTVEQRTNGVSMFTETFTERLGWTMNFSPYPACIIVDGPVGMRCYMTRTSP